MVDVYLSSVTICRKMRRWVKKMKQKLKWNEISRTKRERKLRGREMIIRTKRENRY